MFKLLLDEQPSLREDMVCFRLAAQPEDTWVIFDRERLPFGLQLDPTLQYFIVFDANDTHTEIGPWFDDPTSQTLEFIRKRYI